MAGHEARDQAQRATALNTFVLALIRTADPNAAPRPRQPTWPCSTPSSNASTPSSRAPDQLLQLSVTVGDAYRNRGEDSAAHPSLPARRRRGRADAPADDLMLLTARVRASDDRT